MKLTRTTAAVMVATGVIFFFFPVFAKYCGWGRQTAAMVREAERRNIAVLPSFDFARFRYSNVKRYPKQMERYVADTFPFRQAIISSFNTVQYNILHSRPKNGIIGKDGWLFYNSADDGSTVDDFLGVNHAADNRILAQIEKLNQKREYFSGRGIKYYFVIAPNKVTVYPEHLPDALGESKGETYKDRFMEQYRAYIEKNSLADFVLDLTPILENAKKDGTELYFPQDTHWNWAGRLVAGQAICGRLRTDFADLKPFPNISMNPQRGRSDLANTIGIHVSEGEVGYAPFPDETQWRKIKLYGDTREISPVDPGRFICRHYVNDGGEALSALFIGDSFLDLFQPFPEVFLFKNLWFYSNGKDFASLQKAQQHLQDKNPDLVIEEVVERKICLVQWDE